MTPRERRILLVVGTRVSAGQAEAVTDNSISIFLFSDNCPLRKAFVPDPIGLDIPWLYFSTFMPSPFQCDLSVPTNPLASFAAYIATS